jgi:DNA-directed RNA polymerase subunit K/omega
MVFRRFPVDIDKLRPEIKSKKTVTASERQGRHFLSEFERVAVILHRTKCLAYGDQTTITDAHSSDTPAQIAFKEYQQRVAPITIVRSMPDGSQEEWKSSELELPKVKFFLLCCNPCSRERYFLTSLSTSLDCRLYDTRKTRLVFKKLPQF